MSNRPQSRTSRFLVAAFAALIAAAAFSASAEAHHPYVKIREPVRAASASGKLDFSAATHAIGTRVKRVTFFVDGRRVFVDRKRRWRVPRGLDTRRLSDGRHKLAARVVYRNGAARISRKVIRVSNRAAARDTVAPSAPTGLTATASEGRVELDWNDNPESDFSYYALRRSTSRDGPWERLPGDHESSHYTDDTVADGRRYYYIVTAMDVSVNVSERAYVDATTPEATLDPSAPARSKPVWASDFEGGVVSSWLGAQWDPGLPMSDRIRTDTDSARTGDKSARFDVRAGDTIAGTARAQLWGVRQDDGNELRFREGDDYYLGFSMKLGSDYPMDPDKWQQLVSLMRDGSGQGPLKLGTSFERDSFRLEGPDGDKVYWRGPIARGGWLDFVFRVRFSADPSKGFIEVWYRRPGDGELVRQTLSNGRDRLYVNTMTPGSSHSYLKAGVYRDEGFSTPSTVWYDSFKVGHQFEDVAPG